jgi:hypothetical protein
MNTHETAEHYDLDPDDWDDRERTCTACGYRFVFDDGVARGPKGLICGACAAKGEAVELEHVSPETIRLVTSMSDALSATYARDPNFYGSTYCVACRMHKPVGEFVWDKDGEVVGS